MRWCVACFAFSFYFYSNSGLLKVRSLFYFFYLLLLYYFILLCCYSLREILHQQYRFIRFVGTGPNSGLRCPHRISWSSSFSEKYLRWLLLFYTDTSFALFGMMWKKNAIVLVADPSGEEEVAMDGKIVFSVNAHRWEDCVYIYVCAYVRGFCVYVCRGERTVCVCVHSWEDCLCACGQKRVRAVGWMQLCGDFYK